eukprot:CAMPEP_0115364606 /NCGR_PEP_ID=MMETSP0270-20121206/103854_1 /TAXON_ID=71861 /ORGANISM="Scrippsiella trochoidea, Strain CCMP3099" /LENGTH=69 /DNA_ID=CAMNT_0002787307 /DNA_START=118 /DNA_END=323 /DNA_ORIENTATION=-
MHAKERNPSLASACARGSCSKAGGKRLQLLPAGLDRRTTKDAHLVAAQRLAASASNCCLRASIAGPPKT